MHFLSLFAILVSILLFQGCTGRSQSSSAARPPSEDADIVMGLFGKNYLHAESSTQAKVINVDIQRRRAKFLQIAENQLPKMIGEIPFEQLHFSFDYQVLSISALSDLYELNPLKIQFSVPSPSFFVPTAQVDTLCVSEGGSSGSTGFQEVRIYKSGSNYQLLAFSAAGQIEPIGVAPITRAENTTSVEFSGPLGSLTIKKQLPGPLVSYFQSSFAMADTNSPWNSVANLSCHYTEMPLNTHTVFITSTAYNGNLGGELGADSLCSARGHAGTMTKNLGGTWRAILQSKTGAGLTRISLLNGASVKNTNGDTVHLNAAGFLNPPGNLVASLSYDENGALKAGQAWTGTWDIGRNERWNSTCSAWTNSLGDDKGSFGESDKMTLPWFDQAMGQEGGDSCSLLHSLYCINSSH